jgi:hypothetical protein
MRFFLLNFGIKKSSAQETLKLSSGGLLFQKRLVLKFCYIKKELSFISNRQRRKEGTFCASDLVGVSGYRTHTARPKGAGYARHCKLG